MNVQDIDSNSTYDLIKQGLKASNIRAKAISNNMANINTKDYKKFNVVFEENLEKGNNNSSFVLKRTNASHFSGENEQDDNISIQREEGTSMRTDGNNVDLDVEKANQAANTLKYNALVANINSRFSNIRTVLK